MTLKKIVVSVALAASTASAMAGGFDGPFVQLGMGGSATSTKVSGLEFTNSNISGDGTTSQGNANGLFAAGYSQDLGAFNESLKGFNLAANLYYVIGNQNAGQTNMGGVDGWGDTRGLNANYKLKNTWGISVEPGYNFTDSTLGFVKLAWVNSQGNVNGSYSNSDPSSGGNGTISESKNINGFGYGLGVKQLLTKNIYAGIDLMGVTYGSYKPSDSDGTTSFKPTQFMGFASIGYKF